MSATCKNYAKYKSTTKTLDFSLIVFTILLVGIIQPIHADNTNVEITDLQAQPSVIKVGDTFTINASLVNNSPNTISLQYGVCEAAFSVVFDNHVKINQKNQVCPMLAVLQKVDPGQKITDTGPGSGVTYQAVAAGTANATVTFPYTIRNQTDPNQPEIQGTISKSFLFTIYNQTAQTITPIMSPLVQVRSGISAHDVKCVDGYSLVIKAEDGSPACVTPQTAQKLVQRGWASTTICAKDQFMVSGQCVTSVITTTQTCNGDTLIPYSYSLPCIRPTPTCPTGMTFSNGVCTTTPPYIPPTPIQPQCDPTTGVCSSQAYAYPSCGGAFSGNICQPNSISCPIGLQGDTYGTTCNYNEPKCANGFSAVKTSAGSYLCQPTNPPPLSNPTTYSSGQKVGAFTIAEINQNNVTGYYNSPYPLARPGLGEFTIMHVGDTLNPTCDGSAPLVITAINFPNSITVSTGQSSGSHIGGCPICLSADTQIDTPDGKINVKDIQDGATVLSVDNNQDVIQSKIIKINKVFVGNAHRMIDLKMSDGRELFVSPNHPTYDGRVIANLKVGETYDGSTVESIELVPYKYQYTYDILPDSFTGDYFANGILVGSTLK